MSSGYTTTQEFDKNNNINMGNKTEELLNKIKNNDNSGY